MGSFDLQNILSIDVEDWFHPEYVRRHLTSKEYQITRSLNKILQILSEYEKNLTFFVVGEIAENFPEIIEKVYEQGHEVAFHGFYHKPLWELDAKSFRSEIERFDTIIRTIIREKCLGFRAPSCSIDNRTKWALDVLEKFGYVYDSSVFPTKTPLYGVPYAPTFPYHPSDQDIAKEDENRKIIEFPLLVYSLNGVRIPVGTGFYLRFFPMSFVKSAIRRMNAYGRPAVIAFHPWEISEITPKLDLGPFKSFVTYYNLNRAEKKFRHLLSNFEFVSFRDFIG